MSLNLTMTGPFPVGIYDAPSVATVPNSSTKALSAATKRRGYLFVQNGSTSATIWLRFDGEAASTSEWHLMLGPGSGKVVDKVPQGEVYAISDDAGGAQLSCTALEW
jgi:hypothetical protein